VPVATPHKERDNRERVCRVLRMSRPAKECRMRYGRVDTPGRSLICRWDSVPPRLQPRPPDLGCLERPPPTGVHPRFYDQRVILFAGQPAVSSVPRCLALATTTIAFDQSVRPCPRPPFSDYDNGYVAVRPSCFTVNSINSRPKDSIRQSRRRP